MRRLPGQPVPDRVLRILVAAVLIGLAVGLLLGTRLVLAQRPPPPAAAAAVALPPLALRTPRYEIYASDSASLLAARADVEHAIARFRRHVGEPPAPLAVVVLASDDGTAAVDDRPFRARGLEVLPWVPAPAPRGDGAAGHDAHAVLAHEACHVYLRAHVDRRQARLGRRTAERATLRGAYGHEAVPDWLDEAVASLCESDEAHAEHAAGMRTRLAERIPLAELLAMPHPGTPPTPPTPTGAAAPDTARAAGGTPRVFRRDGRPIAPEDEARIRRALAGDEGTGLVLRPSADTAASRAGVIAQRRRLTAGELAASGRILTFYAQSLSVARFVAARAGDAAIGRLVDAASEGRAVADALAALPGMPGTLPATEAAWLAWVRDGA